MGLHDLARRFATAADELTDAAVALRSADPGAVAFGADAEVGPGHLGRELHRAYLLALDARVREATVLGARLSVLADSVAQAAAGYADADDRRVLR